MQRHFNGNVPSTEDTLESWGSEKLRYWSSPRRALSLKSRSSHNGAPLRVLSLMKLRVGRQIGRVGR